MNVYSKSTLSTLLLSKEIKAVSGKTQSTSFQLSCGISYLHLLLFLSLLIQTTEFLKNCFLRRYFLDFRENVLVVFSGTLRCHFQSLFLPWGPYRLSEMLKKSLFPFTSSTITCHVSLTSSSKESSRLSKPLGLEREVSFKSPKVFHALGIHALPLQCFQTHWSGCYSRIIFIFNRRHVYLSSVQNMYIYKCIYINRYVYICIHTDTHRYTDIDLYTCIFL